MDGAVYRPIVACALWVNPKAGASEYDAGYVARLRDGFRKYLPIPHRFVCFSNVDVPCERIPLKHGWPGWWSKMEAFDPEIAGDILLVDLDTVIVGDVTEIATTRELTMIRWGRVVGSGLMMLPEVDRVRIWQRWIKRPLDWMKESRGDQEFLIPHMRDAAYWPADQVVSYKLHCQGPLPEGARAVCFHGRPRPKDLPSGHWMKGFWLCRSFRLLNPLGT